MVWKVWTSVVAIIKNFAMAIAMAIFVSHDLHVIYAFGDVTMRCDYQAAAGAVANSSGGVNEWTSKESKFKLHI